MHSQGACWLSALHGNMLPHRLLTILHVTYNFPYHSIYVRPCPQPSSYYYRLHHVLWPFFHSIPFPLLASLFLPIGPTSPSMPINYRHSTILTDPFFPPWQMNNRWRVNDNGVMLAVTLFEGGCDVCVFSLFMTLVAFLGTNLASSKPSDCFFCFFFFWVGFVQGGGHS